MVQQISPQIRNEKKEDGLANLIGQIGRWQLLIYATVSVVKLSSGWVQMVILFLTPPLTFWCVEFRNGTSMSVKNSTCYSDCVKYAYDANPFDNTIISEWDLVCERAWLASFTQMVLQLGILIGSIVMGFLSDRYGRKNAFVFSTTSLILIGFAIPFSPDYITFTVLRFFLGVATAGTMVISFVIVMETVGTQYREILGCLFQIPFVIGHMTVPLFAYYFRSWDSYTLAMAVPPLIYIMYFFSVSESPRWLLSVGRVDDAAKIVKRAAEFNGLPTDKVDSTLKCMAEEIRAKSVARANYSDLMGPALRVKTICCCIMWTVLGLTFYGLNQYISLTSPDPFVTVAIAGAMQLPSNLIAICLIKYFGRKSIIGMAFTLGGLCVLLLGVVPHTYSLTLALGTLGVSCMSIVAITIYIYTSELYPTVVRNMSMGACSMCMRVGSMVAPFVSNSTSLPWLPTLIFGITPIAASLACFFLPETKGTSLQDSLEDAKKEEIR